MNQFANCTHTLKHARSHSRPYLLSPRHTLTLTLTLILILILIHTLTWTFFHERGGISTRDKSSVRVRSRATIARRLSLRRLANGFGSLYPKKRCDRYVASSSVSLLNASSNVPEGLMPLWCRDRRDQRKGEERGEGRGERCTCTVLKMSAIAHPRSACSVADKETSKKTN